MDSNIKIKGLVLFLVDLLVFGAFFGVLVGFLMSNEQIEKFAVLAGVLLVCALCGSDVRVFMKGGSGHWVQLVRSWKKYALYNCMGIGLMTAMSAMGIWLHNEQTELWALLLVILSSISGMILSRILITLDAKIANENSK